MYTPDELRTILGEHRKPRMEAVDLDDCPPEIRARIIDYRAKKLGLYRDPQAVNLKAQLDAFKTTILSV